MKKFIDDEPLTHQIFDLLEKGHDKSEIESSLVADGHDALSIKQIMHELSQQQTNKKRVQAITLIITGACLCLLSILLTITSIYPHHSFYMALYGMASMGALLVLAGVLMMMI